MQRIIKNIGGKIINESVMNKLSDSTITIHYIFFEFQDIEYIFSELVGYSPKKYELSYIDENKKEINLYFGDKKEEIEKMIKELKFRRC